MCVSSQGGLLDNPGLVTRGCGNVIDKWDQVCQKLPNKDGQNYTAQAWACLTFKYNKIVIMDP